MSNHGDLLARMVALQQEAIVGSVAYPRRFAKTPTLPYWLNWLGPATYETNSEDELVETRTVTTRLVVAHATQGYDGEPEELLNGYIEAWIATIIDAPGLQSTTYPTEAAYIMPNAILPDSDTGIEYLLDTVSPFVMVGVEFSVDVELVYRRTVA